jgi:hypothetical protein
MQMRYMPSQPADASSLSLASSSVVGMSFHCIVGACIPSIIHFAHFISPYL